MMLYQSPETVLLLHKQRVKESQKRADWLEMLRNSTQNHERVNWFVSLNQRLRARTERPIPSVEVKTRHA